MFAVQFNNQITVNSVKLILIRYKGQIYCLAGTCTYDDCTELDKGTLFGNKLMCPLHGCAYNIQTGGAEYGPAIDGLPKFFADVEGEDVNVFLP